MNYKAIRAFIVLTAIACLSLALLLVAGCSNERSSKVKPSDSAKQNAGTKYTCSMHPEVVQDNAGDCPKCGMKLVEKR